MDNKIQICFLYGLKCGDVFFFFRDAILEHCQDIHLKMNVLVSSPDPKLRILRRCQLQLQLQPKVSMVRKAKGNQAKKPNRKESKVKQIKIRHESSCKQRKDNVWQRKDAKVRECYEMEKVAQKRIPSWAAIQKICVLWCCVWKLESQSNNLQLHFQSVHRWWDFK